MKHKRNIVSAALAVLLCLSLTLPALASYPYAVQKGDSLWKIAKTQMGSGTRWGELYEANRDVISDPAKIYPGQLLTIPTDDADSADGAQEPADAAPPTDDADSAAGVEQPADAAQEIPPAYLLESANSYGEIMKRHASVSAQGVEYIGGEARQFTIFGNDDMQYIGSEAFQRLTMDDRLLMIEDDTLIVTLFLTEDDYQDAVNESKYYFTRSFGIQKWAEASVEDGAFSVVTEMDDAEIVAAHLEAFGYDAAEGAVLVQNYRFDRQDFDLLSHTVTVRYADGTERLLSKTEFAYDAGTMDLMASPFASFFGGEPFEFTVTSDPGMPLLEQTKSFTMSKCLFQIVSNGEYADFYYTDADCTQRYEGRGADDYSDLHLYVRSGFAAATEEQQELFGSIAEKMTATELLSRHESVSSDAAVYYDGTPAVQESKYLDDQRDLFITNAGYGMYLEPTEGRLFQFWEDGVSTLVLSDVEQAVRAEYETLRDSFSIHTLEGEELLYAREKDGELCWISAAPEAAAREYYQSLVVVYGLPEDGFEEGMTLLRSLYLDAETLEESSMYCYLVEADGTKHLLYGEAVGYDYECRYANMPYAPFFETDASRTITLIYDPGTAEEVTVSVSKPEGVRLSALYHGDYVNLLYTDPACTQVYSGIDATPGDSVTFYYKAQ